MKKESAYFVSINRNKKACRYDDDDDDDDDDDEDIY